MSDETKEANKRKEVRVNLVATREFKLGSKDLTPPPNAEPGRASSYTIDLAVHAAKAFVNRGLLRPAFENDAHTLREYGVAERFLAPHYVHAAEAKAKAEATEKAKAAVDKVEDVEKAEAASESSSSKVVRDAIEAGLKKDLEAALTEVGLNPAEYPNNAERTKALQAWLDAN